MIKSLTVLTSHTVASMIHHNTVYTSMANITDVHFKNLKYTEKVSTTFMKKLNRIKR